MLRVKVAYGQIRDCGVMVTGRDVPLIRAARKPQLWQYTVNEKTATYTINVPMGAHANISWTRKRDGGLIFAEGAGIKAPAAA